jgi:ribosome-binding protein aMBF1 (putative translation factor)
MLQILQSPLIKFVLYLLFVGGAVTYLTKNNLDEKSRYILIFVLILPYLFMDQMYNYTEVSTNYENNKQTVNNTVSVVRLNQKTENMNNAHNIENIENINITYEEEIKKQELAKQELAKKELEKKLQITKNMIENFENQTVNNVQRKEKYEPTEPTTTNQVNDLSQIISMLQKIQTLQNNMNNSSSSPSNTLEPLGQNGDGFTNGWDQDYTLLNTNKWAPSLNPPPVCKAEKTCPVCPSITSGYPLSLKEYDSSRKITPPINADLASMNL